MANTPWIGCSGEGEHLIDVNFIRPTQVLAELVSVTSPRVRVIGTMQPRIIRFGGSMGLYGTATATDGTLKDFYYVQQVLNLERLNWFPVPGLLTGNYAQGFFWRLPEGVIWNIRVFY